MVRLIQERVLLIGDAGDNLLSLLMQALPSAKVRSVETVFDGIDELDREPFTAILARLDLIDRRPEAAVRTLRDLARGGRLLLFGQPSHEPLSRQMLLAGADDYLITPTSTGELLEVLTHNLPRHENSEPGISTELGGNSSSATNSDEKVPHPLPMQASGMDGPVAQSDAGDPPPLAVESSTAPQSTGDGAALAAIPIGDILLEALWRDPANAVAIALSDLNPRISHAGQVVLQAGAEIATGGIDRSVEIAGQPPLKFQIVPRAKEAEAGLLAFADRLQAGLTKVLSLQDRHLRLQRLAITDDLTGLYNGRYLRHFLGKMIEKARALRFPVTLLLFDIDNFKQYNDNFGHGVGDDILKQTASLMRRCCRDHDLVARISGDEFAAVFWEKDGPRQSHHGPASRAPLEPQLILQRFVRLLSKQEFSGLGPSGKGSLTISGGLAVYPYDAHDVASLMAAADKELMFTAKRGGKNTIQLVGGNAMPQQAIVPGDTTDKEDERLSDPKALDLDQLL